MSDPAALVVEDGTIVSGANSYVTADEFHVFCETRGLTHPGATADREVLLHKAMDYIRGVETNFQGVRVSEDQETPFPRSPVKLHGFYITDSTIPQEVKDAQCYLAQLAHSQDLLPAATNKEVVKERVGQLETTYAPGGSNTFDPAPAMVYLRPLFRWDAMAGVPIIR